MNKVFLVGTAVFVLVIAGFVVLKNLDVTSVPVPTMTSSGESVTDEEISEERKEAAGTPKNTPQTATKAVDEITIEIRNFAFSPNTFKVTPGAKITVVNRDSTQHTMTADDGKSFDTKLLVKDEPVSYVAPNEVGEYGYHCRPHPSMTGTMVVEE